MAYLSDDEEIIQQESTLDDLYPEDEEENLALQMFREKLLTKDVSNNETTVSVQQIKKEKKLVVKEKKTTTIQKLFDKIEESKPKKWLSLRKEGKKSEIPIVEVVKKRQFNPRLPPYNIAYSLQKDSMKIKEDLLINDVESFPNLLI